MRITFVFTIIISLCFFSCDEDSSSIKKGGYTNNATTLYSKVPNNASNISFTNKVVENMEYNFLTYPYLYTGGGVAVGDLDNDGLQDIFFTSNFESNKLYKNKGNFTFEDITEASNTGDPNGFTTGVTLLDVNNDGWLDIYVCKAGSLRDDSARKNKLFVNQKNGTFIEEAGKWGIDDPGYTTQAYPFDYDKDGDLDLYIVNYRYDFKNNTKISSKLQKNIEEVTSDQLYKNNGTFFTKVTGQAGLYNKTWGLAATVGDFNEDGWEDIYVSNDYLEPDAMYINQKDGTFKNEINSRLNHISFNSMGSDYADLNNDQKPDLITVDMLAENYARSKENMASMSTENFMSMVQIGYHHAYMANMLHYNAGNGLYTETGQLSGIVKTDWSWAPLLADFDNDGLKDIFVSNGVYKDYHNQDFRKTIEEINARGEAMTLQGVLDLIPSEPLDNYIFKNNGDLTFSKKIKDWGLEDPNFSSGAAYGDFDNDGDLDLVVNNANSEAGLYRNNANLNYLQIELSGPKTNKLALGAVVTLETKDKTQHQKLYVTRGFQSSVPNRLHFGLGETASIDRLTIAWPDGTSSVLENPKANRLHKVDYEASKKTQLAKTTTSNKTEIIEPSSLGINYLHQENNFNDYDIQLLLPQKQSTKGTGLAKADVNKDGLEDFFVGNAAGAVAQLYVQKPDGTFESTNMSLWENEAIYEDANALFFDADTDGDVDLYVVSAGYELGKNNPLLQDRLYMNDGQGNFSKSTNALPQMLISGKSVVSADYDGDGDLDLFVGGNVIPGEYPLPPRSYLLNNDGGTFVDATQTSPQLSTPGMISEALFTDFNNDKTPDLLLVGEWMEPQFYTNKNGIFELTESGLEKNEGWWFSATEGDFDGDGDMDYVLGNLGKNNKFQPSSKKPIYIYGKDFDNNGSFDVALSKINEGRLVPVRGKECSSEQNPYLLEKIGTYKEFASLEMKDIYGEDRLKDAYQLQAHTLETGYVENLGNGRFKMHTLPNQAQTGPTLATLARDVNNDGFMDIVGMGAIYDAEVETIRYDSNYGYVLLGDGTGNFENSKDFAPHVNRDTKDVISVRSNNKDLYIVASNNAPLTILSLIP